MDPALRRSLTQQEWDQRAHRMKSQAGDKALRDEIEEGRIMTSPHEHEALAGFRDKPNSIEVHWNAKQEPAFTVKIYFSDDETAVVPAIIEDIHADLRARFLPKPADPTTVIAPDVTR